MALIKKIRYSSNLPNVYEYTTYFILLLQRLQKLYLNQIRTIAISFAVSAESMIGFRDVLEMSCDIGMRHLMSEVTLVEIFVGFFKWGSCLNIRETGLNIFQLIEYFVAEKVGK